MTWRLLPLNKIVHRECGSDNIIACFTAEMQTEIVWDDQEKAVIPNEIRTFGYDDVRMNLSCLKCRKKVLVEHLDFVTGRSIPLDKLLNGEESV